jgi:hypothetical protein
MRIRCAHCGKKRGLGATRRFWDASVWSVVIFRFCGQKCRGLLGSSSGHSMPVGPANPARGRGLFFAHRFVSRN